MFKVSRLCLGLLARCFRSRRKLLLENLALRQQLAVLKRRQDRPTLLPLDKLFWMLACRFWSEWKKSLFVVTPETVVRWHRAGFRLLCLATILSGFEMNSIGKRSKIRSAITLAPCSSSFGSGLESFFASFAPAEA
jgi:hypothetical protein